MCLNNTITIEIRKVRKEMFNFKNKIAIGLALGLTFASQNSNAAIGLITNDLGYSIVGAALTFGGPALIAEGVQKGNIETFAWGTLVTFLIPVGVVVLDDSQATQSVSFGKLNEAAIQKLKLNINDAQDFNNEIDLINATLESAQYESSGMEHETAIRMSQEVWQDSQSNLSEGTVRVLKTLFSR